MDHGPQVIGSLARRNLRPACNQRIARAVYRGELNVLPQVLRDRSHVSEALIAAGVEHGTGRKQVRKHIPGGEESVRPSDDHGGIGNVFAIYRGAERARS